MRLLPVLLWGLQAAACIVIACSFQMHGGFGRFGIAIGLIAALTGACAGLLGMLVLGCIEEREGDAYAW